MGWFICCIIVAAYVAGIRCGSGLFVSTTEILSYPLLHCFVDVLSQDLPRLVGNLTVLPLQWQYMSACLEIKHICKVDFKSHLKSTPKPEEAFASPGYDGSKLCI
jgi:hypothetical protein